MNGSCIVGIDIGGTSIKMGLLDTSGTILQRTEQPTHTEQGIEAVLQRIGQMAEQLVEKAGSSKEQLLGIGVGVPGPVDVRKGRVYHAVNLGWHDIPLRDLLADVCGLPVQVENDANAAALGERWRGAGAGADNLVMITLGTGVGGGIIVNGEVIHGVNGIGGEIGHLTLEPTNGPLCNCGKKGCLEAYASATALIRAGQECARSGKSKRLADLLAQQGKLTAEDVMEAAKAGDTAALEVVTQAADALGLALSHLIYILNPAKIVIGGGVSAAGPFFFERVRAACSSYVAFPQAFQSCEIVPAQLGNDAGMIGAASLVLAHAAKGDGPRN